MNTSPPRLKRIAIVGPPNVGKSTLFNKISGAYVSVVSNYAQTTVETFRREADFAGERCEIVDTPGIFSLFSVSHDEEMARQVMLENPPDVLIFCGDATSLKRTLVLASQVLELEIPTVFCLNKVDEAARRGITVDERALARELGIPLALNAAVHGAGLEDLENVVRSVGVARPKAEYTEIVERAVAGLKALFPAGAAPSRGILLLFLLGEDAADKLFETRFGASGETLDGMRAARKTFFGTASPLQVKRAIFNAREEWADAAARKAVTRRPLDIKSLGYEAARLSRTPLTGVPILLGVLWATFYGVGRISTWIAGALDGVIFVPATQWISGMATNPLLNEFLVGNYGLVTMGLFNALGTVIPILLVFFVIINFLEEIGYVPNVGVLASRLMAPMGLSGKSLLPMVLGFGCNTMATMASRMLETRKERIIASFLIALGFPCAVQLGILLAIMATAPFSVLLIVMGSLIIVSVAVGLALNRFIPTARKADFIMELPTFSAPVWWNIAQKTYFRIRWFMKEALPMFVAAALMMFFLEKSGLLSVIKALLRPVVTGLLTLPDKMTDVFILVLARREIGAVLFKQMYDAGGMDYYQTVTGLVVITLFIPCVSNTMVMAKELGVRWAVFINVSIIAIALAAGGVVNFLMRL